MPEHAADAIARLARADELDRKGCGMDVRTTFELAAAQVSATLAVAEAITAAHGPFVKKLDEPAEPEPKIMPCGSAGLCMAAYHARPGATSEFCHFPHMHTGPHSWETTLGRTE